jgi:CheY-like chemotaxis protein
MPPRILLVDDEEIVLKGWVKALRSEGYSLLLARTSQEALEVARREPVDLVIIDYVLGNTTGIEVLNLIRKKRPLVRSILISAQIETTINETELRDLLRDKVEVDLYIHKPVRNRDLREAVSLLLQNKQVDWQTWAQKVKKARAAKVENGVEAAGRLKPFLKNKQG